MLHRQWPARPIKRAIAVVASVFLLPNQHHHDATAFQNSEQFSSESHLVEQMPYAVAEWLYFYG